MTDSGGEGPREPSRARKVRTREPTLIGMVAATPPVAPPKAEPAPPPAIAPKPPTSGIVPRPAPAFTARGLPARKPFPRRPPSEPSMPKVAEVVPPPDPSVAALAEEPTQTAARSPATTLVDEWPSTAGPEPDDEGGAPLRGEITQVTDEPEAIHTDPGLDIPYEGDLATETTRPAASAAQPEGRTTDPLPSEGPDDEPDAFVPVSTVIVDSASLQQPAQVYTMDLQSGFVERQVTTDETAVAAPGRKSSLGLVIGLAIGGLVMVAAGIGLGYVFMASSGDDDAEATAAVAPPEEPTTPDVAPPLPPEPAPAPVPTVAVAPTADVAPEEGEVEAGVEEEDEAQPAPVAAGAVSIADVEAYELELPRLTRRARRMPDAERLRQAGRLRARAIAAYRSERWEDAATAYAEALTFSDWDVASIEGMARARARQLRFPEAIAWAGLAVRRNPRSAGTFRVLGDVWRQAGHPDRARDAWRRGLRRHPEDRWLRQRLRELDGP